MKVLICTAMLFIAVSGLSQQIVKIKVAGGEDKTPVAASIVIQETGKGIATDSTGTGVVNFPANGNYTLVISAVGYTATTNKVTIPYPGDIIEIVLEAEEEEMEEIIIQSTRTS